jgi:hypothetical protein
MQLADQIIAIYPQITYDDFANGKIVLQNDGSGAYIKSWKYPNLTQPTATQLANITTPPLALLVPQYEVATQSLIDAYAQSWGYDNIVSAASYANSTNAKFKAEALALIAWRDAVWAYCYASFAAVQAGTTPIPTSVSAFTATLPAKPARPA